MKHAAAVLAFFLAAGLHAEKPASQTRPPRFQKRVDPQYTEEARAARLQGSVWLSAVLLENSRLIAIQIEKGIGSGLDEKAIDCVRQWQFEPATRDGAPVSSPVRIQITFRLLD
jgi:TonB family protein